MQRERPEGPTAETDKNEDVARCMSEAEDDAEREQRLTRMRDEYLISIILHKVHSQINTLQ